MDSTVRQQRIASFTPFITCSTCDVDVPMHLMVEHVCQRLPAMPFVGEPENIETQPNLSSQMTSSRPAQPAVPRIDPFAVSRPTLIGELTPASSHDSAAASPVSPSTGRRSPFLQPPRKASMPAPRRPPSPELLSQDCAFPPFPTSKVKSKEAARKANARGRTLTPETSLSIGSFAQEAKRSTLVGTSKARSRQGTSDSARPSITSSSRQASYSSSRGESRRGSIDVSVPPLPSLQRSTSHSSSPASSIREDPKLEQSDSRSPVPESTASSQPASREAPPFPSFEAQGTHEPNSIVSVSPSIVGDSQVTTAEVHPPSDTQPKEPSYRAKRPPPIPNMPPSSIDEFSASKAAAGPPNAPSPTPSTIARTLTSLFTRKRGQSTSSKRGGSKTPATDGPRFIALSPDPDPQDIPEMHRSHDHSSHSSLDTDMITSPPIQGGIQELPRAPIDFRVNVPPNCLPEASQAQFDDADDDDDDDSSNYGSQPDTMQMQQDLDKNLEAVTVGTRLSTSDDKVDEMQRASVDSASSYGSVEFSRSSIGSRSFSITEGHSQGSSISTASTNGTNDDLPAPYTFSRMRNSDVVPDSPTDPYLQFGSLAPIPENLSPEQEKEDSLIIPARAISIPPTPETEVDKLSFSEPPKQRRPSTPVGCKGFCRGCSQAILSGQKSISSKDGRLTGKYHKECFVCYTCKEQFATADFYVHEDHPFCAHHYHVLNGTLCEGCGAGIEGHYLETSNISGQGTKKFHPDCLKCATCRVQLGEDYFELSGKVYCERDAFKVASGPRSPYDTAPSRPSPLNREYISSGINGNEPSQGLGAARFPERRLTRLMTTS